MKRITLIFLGTILWVPAIAGSAYLHLGSKHGEGCDSCNERNLGLGWRGEGSLAPMAGFYDNSYGETSVYVGVNRQFVWGFSGSIAGVTGYEGHLDNDVMVAGEILVMPMLHWTPLTNSPIGPMLSWAPAEDRGVFLLSIRVFLDE